MVEFSNRAADKLEALRHKDARIPDKSAWGEYCRACAAWFDCLTLLDIVVLEGQVTEAFDKYDYATADELAKDMAPAPVPERLC
jgi:hypothetical protein